jgi:hypothetical protein
VFLSIFTLNLKLKKNMKFFLAVSLLLLTLTASAQNVKRLDEKYGFRNVVLESDTSAFDDLVLVSEDIHNRIYTRTGDDLKIADYDLEGIFYQFYKGKLSIITIATKGNTNSSGALAILKSMYGSGQQPNRYIEKYYWRGQRVYMGYEQNSATKDAKISIFSLPLNARIESDQKNSAAKAASDF